MTSRTYRTCERIMEAAVKEGFVNQIPWCQLRRIVEKVAGGDPRTVSRYLKHLLDFGFVEPVLNQSIDELINQIERKNKGNFQIDLLKLPYPQTRLDAIVQAGR